MSTTATAPKTATAKARQHAAFCDPTLCTEDADGVVCHSFAPQAFESKNLRPDRPVARGLLRTAQPGRAEHHD